MGNDASCRVVDVGSVKVRMFDGVIHTITEVKHKPDLRRSLISVGAMSGIGLKTVVEGEKNENIEGFHDHYGRSKGRKSLSAKGHNCSLRISICYFC